MYIGIVPGEIRILREYRGLPEPSRGLNGPTWAIVEIEGSKGSVGRAPTRTKPNWFRVRGAGPLFPSPPLPFLPPLLLLLGIGGALLVVGVGLPLGAPPLAGCLLLLYSFIYWGRGAPLDT